MASIRTRVLVAAVTTAIAGLGAWAVLAHRRAASGPVRIAGDPAAAQELLVERQQGMRGSLAGASPALSDTKLVREPVSEHDAGRLFAMPDDVFQYDPCTYYRYRGGLERRVELPDHPDGYFIKHTSAEGFSEDFDHLPGKRDLFVVVTGDSHTDGLCNNRESFANRLEAMLAERHAGLAVEVLNTGVSGYGFYNYLGVLENMLPEKPQAFVVAFYGGNDFLDVIKPWHYFHHTALPPRRADYWEKLDRVTAISNAAVANALNQLLFFQYNPDQVDLALAGATQACLEIVRICEDRGIRLFFVYIPPGFSVEGELNPKIAEAKAALALSDYDLNQYHRLADKLIGVLRERGVDVTDLRQAFTGDIGEYYWSDLHINLKAHRRIAELLLPKIEAACMGGR